MPCVLANLLEVLHSLRGAAPPNPPTVHPGLIEKSVFIMKIRFNCAATRVAAVNAGAQPVLLYIQLLPYL